MRKILFEYSMNPTTWVYLSSLLTIGIYFKFRRFWSVRNLDLVGLIAFAPGLLLVGHGLEQLGYVWLFSVGGFFLVRLLVDPVMVRRPLLEPNLTADGLTFTGVALLVFLITNVLTGTPSLEAARQSEQRGVREHGSFTPHGPGYSLFFVAARLPSQAIVAGQQGGAEEASQRGLIQEATTRTIAILAHLAIVIGMALIGYRHFDNVETGVAAASLYLLLPYTAQMTGEVDHVLPAAFLVWAVAAYRRPMVAGILMGLAVGVIYYPLFLLPLWCGFYWRRGLIRFSAGLVVMWIVLVVLFVLAFTSSKLDVFWGQFLEMFGWSHPSGFWQYHEPAYRIPVVAAFVALCSSLALWPAQKNLGTLLSCSAAVMLGTQFWHANDGGLYMAWYLPLLVLTIFRPNLEDRVAITALSERWGLWPRGRAGI